MANLEVLALDEATPQIRAPGSGDGYTMPRPLAIGIGTITTDIKVLDLSVTWNDAGVTFTGMKFNVTDTASNATSLLIDLQVNGSTKFSVSKTVTNGIVYGGATIRDEGSGQISFNRVYYFSYGPNGLQISNPNLPFGWSSSIGGGNDVNLYRDAASILAQRVGTTAQTWRLYRTYTDASNYQRLTETWNTSTAVIHNEGAGTGADGSIAFNDAALATDATKGFIMIPSCAGTPTGTPADIPTGQVPIVFDSTNNKIYVYDGGWIATAALT